MGSVLFVCTGNICRSPMAEYLLRKRLAEAGETGRVSSAGILAVNGLPASAPAIEAMREIGISMERHRSRQLTESMLRDADLVVVMTRGHESQIRLLFPGMVHKVTLLKAFDPTAKGEDVPDPIGSSLEVYRRVRDTISAALPGIIRYLKELGRGGGEAARGA